MGERYAREEIDKRIHGVSVKKRRQMVQQILDTIDQDNIERTFKFEMRSTLKIEGLSFNWKAWRYGSEFPNTFLDDEKGKNRLIKGVNHWLPTSLDVPEPHSRWLNRRYRTFIEKHNQDPILGGAISTAIVAACMRKEQEGITS